MPRVTVKIYEEETQDVKIHSDLSMLDLHPIVGAAGIILKCCASAIVIQV